MVDAIPPPPALDKPQDGWTDEASMAVCAVRYCIGRRSYIVGHGCRWARTYGRRFLAVRRVLIRDLQEAVRDADASRAAGRLYYPLGDDIDEREWRAVLAELLAMDAGT